MNMGTVDIQSRFINALRTQASHQKGEPRNIQAAACPYCESQGRVFQSLEQLLDHTKLEHNSEIKRLSLPRAREKILKDLSMLRGDETARHSSPDIAGLSLEPGQTSPTGRKRRAESDLHAGKDRSPSRMELVDPDYSRQIPFTNKGEKPRTRRQETGLFNPKQTRGTVSPRISIAEPISEQSINADSSDRNSELSKTRGPTVTSPSHLAHSRQPGLIELQKYDSRYPGLLLQPDSRPISQEQLASEVKSIYAGLTMVETKCIHVDRAQAAAPKEANGKLAPDHWQALIALHRTLLHEHHDFFLASQHPSASPALRRLAGKYTMPARMWKHGIHSFLELLRQNLPYSLDYMLAFIYLAYQMMALLYETVPAFEDTWIECLGDLGRYRMAIEDEDIRDRETWAGVARSWYSKAADKNPAVGRLSHHLAILARPNALQQLYYYTTSLTCVEPFPSARESIMTLFRPFVQDDQPVYSPGLPIDTLFTMLHALLFTRLVKHWQDQARQDFVSNLDNHIGRVTAKWKEQGVYIAVSNITAWFDYGVDVHVLRQLFLLRALQRRKISSQSEQQHNVPTLDQPKPTDPKITEDLVPSQVDALSSDSAFAIGQSLTNDTFALALRRIGDKNVLPHVHVMLSFINTLSTIPYVSHLVNSTPWAELVSFLNTLIKTENQKNTSVDINTLLSQSIFPNDHEARERDELPLPEDWLIRGLVWSQEYLPTNWLERERDEEERYLELASTAKSRTERVLRLGYRLSTTGRWISYDPDTHTFAVFNA